MKLQESLDELPAVLDSLATHVDAAAITRAREVAQRAEERRGQEMEATVIAFAGATGSGKSSLINALVGHSVARVAAQRPTTAAPLAVGAAANNIVGMLNIPQRVQTSANPLGCEGGASVVLVDLPDIDSIEAAHRSVASQLIARADVLVWVADPQKYADAILHEDYLRHMGEHADIMVAVLNQADRLSPSDRPGVVRDFSRLLEADGVSRRVFVTSAATGEGIAELRSALCSIAQGRHAAALRMAADIRTAARDVMSAIESDGGSADFSSSDAASSGRSRVVHDVMKAAGAGVASEAAAGSYRVRARRATGWPPARLIRRVDPLQRLHLMSGNNTRPAAAVGASNIRTAPAVHVQAEASMVRYAVRVSAALPVTWRMALENDVRKEMSAVLASCDQAIAGVDVESQRRPHWWALLNALQWFSFGVGMAGALWLLGLWIADAVRWPTGEIPTWGVLPVPTVLLMAGVVSGIVWSILSRLGVAHGARFVSRRVAATLERDIARLLDQKFFAKIDSQISLYRTCRGTLRELAQTTV